MQHFPTARLGPLTVKIGSGVTPKGGDSTYVRYGIPLIRSQNVIRDTLDLTDVARITSEQHREMANSVVLPGDVLLNITGASIGRTCVVPYSAQEANVNQHVCIIRCGEQLRPDFLFHYLSSVYGQKQIDQCQAGGNRQGLNYQQIAGFSVPLPPLSEQKSIAAVLSAWDRAISQTAALIAAKERLKQGLMYQLLTGQRRLRGFRDPWRKLHLGDLFTERREPGQNGLPMLSVTLDFGIVRRESLDKPVRTSLEHHEHLLVRRGDIAYNMMRMWQGGSGMVMEDGVVSPAYVVCAPTRKIDSKFAHHLFQSPRMIYLFWAFSYGLTDDRRRLYYDEFARVPVSIPSLKEQRRIATLLDCLELEISLLHQRRESITRQKRGLMQQLLTGKVRVPKSLLKKGARS